MMGDAKWFLFFLPPPRGEHAATEVRPFPFCMFTVSAIIGTEALSQRLLGYVSGRPNRPDSTSDAMALSHE